jgi:hypothetical protein
MDPVAADSAGRAVQERADLAALFQVTREDQRAKAVDPAGAADLADPAVVDSGAAHLEVLAERPAAVAGRVEVGAGWRVRRSTEFASASSIVTRILPLMLDRIP